jgi:gas vesicle protein
MKSLLFLGLVLAFSFAHHETALNNADRSNENRAPSSVQHVQASNDPDTVVFGQASSDQEREGNPVAAGERQVNADTERQRTVSGFATADDKIILPKVHIDTEYEKVEDVPSKKLGHEEIKDKEAAATPTLIERAKNTAKNIAAKVGGLFHSSAHKTEESAKDIAERAQAKSSDISQRAKETATDLKHGVKQAGDRAADKVSEMGATVRDKLHEVKDRAVEMGTAVGDKAHEASDLAAQQAAGVGATVRDKLHDASEKVKEMASGAADKLSEAKDAVGEKVSGVGVGIRDTLYAAKDKTQGVASDLGDKLSGGPRVEPPLEETDIHVRKTKREPTAKYCPNCHTQLDAATMTEDRDRVEHEPGMFDKLKHKASEFTDKLRGVKETAEVKVSELQETARDKLGLVEEKAHEVADLAGKETKPGIVESIKERVSDLKERWTGHEDTKAAELERKAKEEADRHARELAEAAEKERPGFFTRMADKLRGAKDTVEDKVSGVGHRITDNVHAAKDKVDEKVTGVGAGVRERLHDTTQKIKDTATHLSEKIRGATETAEEKAAEVARPEDQHKEGEPHAEVISVFSYRKVVYEGQPAEEIAHIHASHSHDHALHPDQEKPEESPGIVGRVSQTVKAATDKITGKSHADTHDDSHKPKINVEL